MKAERKTLTCAHCGQKFECEVVTEVDLRRAEDCGADLRDGGLFTFLCPHCGLETKANHYLLWYDPDHSAAVCNVTCASEKNALDETLSALASLGRGSPVRRRVVSSPARLCEKIEIFSAGLDDRAVEIVKLYLAGEVRAQHPDKTLTEVLCCPQGDTVGFVFLCPDGTLTSELPRDRFDAAARKFPLPSQQPEVVDANWALKFLTGGMKTC